MNPLALCLLLIPPAEPQADRVEVLMINHVYSIEEGKLKLTFTQIGGLDADGRWHWWRMPKRFTEETEERRITFDDRGTLRRIEYRTVIRRPSIVDLEVQDRELLPVHKRIGLGGM